MKLPATVMEDRECTRCHEFQPHHEYYKKRDGRFAKRVCKTCVRTMRTQRYWDIHRERHQDDPERRWKEFLWTHYRLTPQRYFAILAKQGGVCGVCSTDHPGGRGARFHVDHDHACCPGDRCCGKCIRGLLCLQCNTALGLMRDDTDRLTNAIAYILNPPGIGVYVDGERDPR